MASRQEVQVVNKWKNFLLHTKNQKKELSIIEIVLAKSNHEKKHYKIDHLKHKFQKSLNPRQKL